MHNRTRSPRVLLAAALIVIVSAITATASWMDYVNPFKYFASAETPARSETAQPSIGAPVFAGVTTNGGSGLAGSYLTLADAITALNAATITSPVIITADGTTETAPAGGYAITATGTAVNTITINGAGTTITAPNPQASGNLNDAIFKIIGGDYITINGFTMLENAANTTTVAGTNNMTEWGVALLYATSTNGAQNNTISNNTIDLNRTYQNTFGIYSNSTHTATSVTTSATATTAAGGNSGLAITGNSITDVNTGILVVGPTAAADHNDGLVIGGTAPNANTITNYGTTGTFSGYANVSGTVNGIQIRNLKNFTISYNTVQSSNGGVTVGTLRGIFVNGFTNAPTGTITNSINNNNVSVRSGLVGGAILGIHNDAVTTNATTTLNINNNDFNNFGHTVSGTAAITAIQQASTAGTVNINSNTFTNLSFNTTGTSYLINNNSATNNFTVNGNSIVGSWTRTGAGLTYGYYNFGSPTGGTGTVSGNNFSNVTLTGASQFFGIRQYTSTTQIEVISGNTISNVSGSTSSVTGISHGYGAIGSSVNGNIVTGLSGSGTGAVVGINLGDTTASLGLSCYNNLVNTLSSSGAATVAGIIHALGANSTIYQNKVYGISNTNAGGFVNGLTVSSGTTVNVRNNLIGDLTTPNANAANPLNGINIAGGTTVIVDFNTVYMNATSVGALFGSSALGRTAGSADLTMRNNILVNLSTPNGAGLTVAYRRSSVTLTTYNAASNNNLLFAGTPSASNLLFFDSATSIQTLAAYKAFVSPRDSASISENPGFVSTTGSNANFLHINTATPTQIESGGIPVAGITVDFDGDTRNASTPDIGADEFAGVGLDLAGPIISYTPLLNTSSTGTRTLTVTITDASGVASGGLAPRIYQRKTPPTPPTPAGDYSSLSCTGTSPNYTCTIESSIIGPFAPGDVIDYFIVAQDTLGNVSVSPSAGAAATDVNTVTTPPTTPSSYLIVGSVSGTLTADGVGGGAPNFASLTNPGGVFEYINNNSVTGNITVNISADLTAETGTHALNAFDAPYTVTIVPTGAARIVSGAAASTALIRTNGASRVTIDGSIGGGGTDRSLLIENTSLTTPQVVRFGSIGATAITANTLKNSIVINGVNTSSAVVVTDNAGTAGTFNNITIQNNEIRRAYVGIFTNSTVGAGNGSNLLITQNKLDNSGALAVRNVGIYVQGADGATVSNNSIGNFDTSNGEDDFGIWFATGTINSMMSANTVTTLGMTAASVAFGPIGLADTSSAVNSGNNILGNTVSNITTGTSATDAVFGILIQSGGTTVQRNKITGINNTSTGTYGAFGIDVVSGNNVILRNNFVSDVTGNMSGGAAFSTSFGIFGIRINGGTGHQILHNSVNLYGARAGTANSSLLTSALAIGSAAFTGMDVRNNIFANNITGGTTSVANVAVYLPSGGTSAMNLTWNNNSYYFGADVVRAGAGQAGTTAGTNFFTTFDPTMTTPASNLRSYTSTLSVGGANDDSSQGATTAVPFVSDTDLHLSSPTSLEVGSATPIVGLTIDYDNDPRPATTPDIGADEIVGYQGGSLPAGTYYNVGIGVGALGGDVTVTNKLFLLGDVNGGGFTMTLGCDASVDGAGASNYIDGAVRKEFCTTGLFEFPVGQGGFTPAAANVTALGVTPSSLTVTVFGGTLAGFDPAQSLSRNWEISEVGDLTADLSFAYLASDANGDESNYRVWRREGNGTITNMCPTGPCVVPSVDNLGPVLGVTTFSRWTGAGPLAPTAAEVSLAGRVTTADGRGIRNAVMVLSGNSLTQPMRVVTGSFGYYKFDGLEAGETYVVTVNSKRFMFSVPSRVVNLPDSITDLDFIALPQE
ncbi:MAG: carboxypeptidase regulatory-like domain-containing protein [Pyrinomonadaceae bacterium]|nr:carboxypeptidase regulatory-like domain-containing protein [Pyrinomonadaceae bacterium]